MSFIYPWENLEAWKNTRLNKRLPSTKTQSWGCANKTTKVQLRSQSPMHKVCLQCCKGSGRDQSGHFHIFT